MKTKTETDSKPQATEAPGANAQAQPGNSGNAQKNNGGPIAALRNHPLFAEAVLVLLVIAVIGGYLYWQNLQSTIFTETADIEAPVISVAPLVPGPLEKLYVEVGDTVSAGQRLALIGNSTLYSTSGGEIIGVTDTPGAIVGPQTPVVKMIDPGKMRLVGQIPEDKGLKDIAPGQGVVFTVDAFPAKTYNGTVESVALSAHQSDIVFSISGQRQVRDFDITVLYDTAAYPELKNGMSAKMWIYK